MDVADAFVCFANLLNRPCQMAFYRIHQHLVCCFLVQSKQEAASFTVLEALICKLSSLSLLVWPCKKYGDFVIKFFSAAFQKALNQESQLLFTGIRTCT